MSLKPWINGPVELLNHAYDHLSKEEEFDLRIAMISVDNAVELMIKVFLGLPKREVGYKIPRRELNQIFSSFPDLLDGLEQYASAKIIGISLSDLEWFHRIRNRLYHEGYGITIGRGSVVNYYEIAKILLNNLFEIEDFMLKIIVNDSDKALAEFIRKYADIDIKIRNIISSCFSKDEQELYIMPPIIRLSKIIIDYENLGKNSIEEIDYLKIKRNKIVHSADIPDIDELISLNEKQDKILLDLSKLEIEIKERIEKELKGRT